MKTGLLATAPASLAILALGAAQTAPAQTAPAQTAPAQTAAPPAVSGAEVVVHGARSKPSNWREAQTSHVVVLSDGGEAELVRMTRNLERLHFLLAGLLDRSDTADDPIRIRITLIGDVPTFQAMELRDRRWQQGPFNDLFQLTRYYDPREDGAVMASTRVDQSVVVEHTPANGMRIGGALTGISFTRNLMLSDDAADQMSLADPAASQAGLAMDQALLGDFATAGMRGPHDLTVTYGEKRIPVSAANLLYAGYAQHYLLSHFPAAYPRWYLDGFGQMFATMVAKGDTALQFGRAPEGAGIVLDQFGGYPIKDVLDDRYLDEKPSATRWTPIHAWLLTHFLFFSDTRRPQLRRYLSDRAAGVDAATAAQAFGDPKQLTRELRAYFGARKPYEQVTYDPARIEQPGVRRLSEGEAAFVRGRLELGARVVLPPPPAADDPADKAALAPRLRTRAIAERDRWLARLQGDAARWPGDAGAQLLLAEAECRSERAERCLAAADAALALLPNDSRALAWRGDALAQQAAALPPDRRPAALAAARRVIASANRASTEAVLPLIGYYDSFARVGEPAPTRAIDGLQKAAGAVPNAPATRLRLATALAGRQRGDVARLVILPVARGPYDSPERPAAAALLDRLAAPAPAPATLAQP